MTDPEAAKLVAGYATRTLNEVEEARLFRTAAEDQSVFDALVQEEDIREIIDDPVCHRRILKALRQQGSRQSHFLTLWNRPSLYAFAGAAAMAAVVTVVLYTQQTPDHGIYSAPLSAGFVPLIGMRQLATPRRAAAETAADPLLALPPQEATSAELGLNKSESRPTYAVGERMRIGFTTRADAHAVLIETRNDGSTVQLFPNRFMSSPLVTGGRQTLIPPAGQGDLEVEGMHGSRRLRLLVTSPDTDPLSLDTIGMAALAGKVTVIEREYTVEAAHEN